MLIAYLGKGCRNWGMKEDEQHGEDKGVGEDRINKYSEFVHKFHDASLSTLRSSYT